MEHLAKTHHQTPRLCFVLGFALWSVASEGCVEMTLHGRWIGRRGCCLITSAISIWPSEKGAVHVLRFFCKENRSKIMVSPHPQMQDFKLYPCLPFHTFSMFFFTTVPSFTLKRHHGYLGLRDPPSRWRCMCHRPANCSIG